MTIIKKYFPKFQLLVSRTIRPWNHIWWKPLSQYINEVADANHAEEKNLVVNYAVTWKIQVLLKVNIQTKFIK